MKIHSNDTIKEIKRLREQGTSINEIVKLLGVPKTTVWHHIKNVNVLPEFIQILRSKRGGGYSRTSRDWAEAESHAAQLLSSEYKNLVLSATMLYWGEGGKKVCDIINTDPQLLKLYIKFLHDVLKITNNSIKFSLRVFTGMDVDECLAFWSKNLNIDPSIIMVRYNDGGIHGKAKYGMCRITLKKGAKMLKLMHSLIQLGYSELMGYQTPIGRWLDYKRVVQKN